MSVLPATRQSCPWPAPWRNHRDNDHDGSRGTDNDGGSGGGSGGATRPSALISRHNSEEPAEPSRNLTGQKSLRNF